MTGGSSSTGWMWSSGWMHRFISSFRTNQSLLCLRLTWRRSWNYPQRSRRLSWRSFSKTVHAPQSPLSLNSSRNSRNSGDSAGLRNKPSKATVSSLSTALNLWILDCGKGNSSLGYRQGKWMMRRNIWTS